MELFDQYFEVYDRLLVEEIILQDCQRPLRRGRTAGGMAGGRMPSIY